MWQATRKEVERYIEKQRELIDMALRCREPLRPTILADAMAEIVVCEKVLEQLPKVRKVA